MGGKLTHGRLRCTRAVREDFLFVKARRLTLERGFTKFRQGTNRDASRRTELEAIPRLRNVV